MGGGDHPRPVPQPLDGAARVENAALQHIAHLLPQLPADGGDQAAVGGDPVPAQVHEGEAAGAVGVLRHAGAKAALAEKGGLLVPHGGADGDARQIAEAGMVGHHPIGLAVGHQAGQHLLRDVQGPQDLLIPAELLRVQQHGAGSIGNVGDVGLAPGELPDEPALHGAEEDLPILGPAAQGRVPVQEPFQLGAGEIGVDDKARLFPDIGPQARLFQILADVRRPAALPADGVADAPARGPVPEDGGLPLVGDADGGDLRGAHAALFIDLRQGVELGRQDLLRIMLHPAGAGIDLLQGILGLHHGVAANVEEDGPGAGGALVQG